MAPVVCPLHLIPIWLHLPTIHGESRWGHFDDCQVLIIQLGRGVCVYSA